jgi:hypothetical protein
MDKLCRGADLDGVCADCWSLVSTLDGCVMNRFGSASSCTPGPRSTLPICQKPRVEMESRVTSDPSIAAVFLRFGY